MRYRRCLNSTTITQNTKHMWRRELQLKPITRFRKVKSKRKSAPSALTRIGFLTCHICGAQMLLLDCITLTVLLTWLLSSSIISICRPDQQFPLFGNPNTELPQGTSLCKLGFPFHEFKTQFDPASSSFVINDPVNFVRYPLDGILTRYINLEARDKARTGKFIEMPGHVLR